METENIEDISTSLRTFKRILINDLLYLSTRYVENLHATFELRSFARHCFSRLCSQIEQNNGLDIICEKYNTSFNIRRNDYIYDDNEFSYLANAYLKTQFKKERNPFSLKEIAMVKVAQQITKYNLIELLWLYFSYNHLINIFFRAGVDGYREVYSVKKVLMLQLCKHLYPKYRHPTDDDDNPTKICINPIPYCMKCYEIEFNMENLHDNGLEPHCSVCGFITHSRLSTSVMDTYGHFTDCSVLRQ